MPDTPSVLSVNVGLPQDVAWEGRTVHTGVWKYPVQGPTMVRHLNIDGDGQGDLAGHGGEQRAVLVYQIESYAHWQQHFGRDDFEYGQFGENFTVNGLPDEEVCIGDRYRIGDAEFEVTQPRVTCYRVGMRLGEPELPSLLVSHHRPGFYMRVITEGHVRAGDQITKTRTGPGAVSVADTDALLYLPHRDHAKLHAALEIPALSPGWQQSFHELVEHDDPAGATAEPAWNGFRALTVTKVVAETSTVSSIYLATPDGEPLPAARAGQFLAVRVSGAADPAPVRSYSLSSMPDGATYRISVKRESHGLVSTYVNRDLRVGAVLDVAAPRGEFVLDDDTGPLLLVSAGIGVTPVLAMLHQLAAEHSERQIQWIHGARGPSEHALAAEAHALIAALPNAHAHIFYSGATPAERRHAHAAAGHITRDALHRLGVPIDASAYICGPAGFMSAVRDALTAIGVDASRVHTELFGALPSSTPGVTSPPGPAPHQPAGAPGTGPLVTFARSGIATHFGVGLKSVLELADACDVSTCVTQLLSGEVSYDPHPLELPVDGEVLICCAQPTTELVLDL